MWSPKLISKFVMAQLLDFQLQEFWREAWFYQDETTKLTRLSHTPLPDVTCPHTFEHHVVAVAVSTPKGESYWTFAGFLNQVLPGGFGGRIFVDTNAVNKQKIFLNRWQLLVFPKFTNTYQLSFEFPFWFEDVVVNIMEYTGLHLDPLEAEVKATEALSRSNTNQLTNIGLNVEELLDR